jgi:hypothetical protein
MESRAREPRVYGEAIVYRLFDVGYEIRLEQVASLLASSAPQRPRPARGEAQAIQIANPPVTVNLGAVSIPIGGVATAAELSARIFDFGVLSLRVRVPVEPALAWREFAAFGAALGTFSAEEQFEAWRDRLLERIGPAIARPGRASVTEEYTVFRLHRIEDASGGPFAVSDLGDEQIAGLLVGESRPLCAAAQKEMVSARLSYFEDDLTVLTWNAALVVEPVVEDEDVQYVLEFANAQLLELRFSDNVLDDELPRIYEEVGAARRAFHLLGRRFSRLLAALQTRVADSTELVERVENSLKVTDDVFLARIYTTALDIFRGPIWRSGIDRKMGIVRDTYAMLNAESQALRTEVLEMIIVALIVLEIVLALWRH